MQNIWFPPKEVFDTPDIQKNFAIVSKYSNETWNNLYNWAKKILSTPLVNDLIHHLDQKDVQEKIIQQIKIYRDKLMKNLNMSTMNSLHNTDNYATIEYFQTLKEIIRNYPYQAIFENESFDVSSINFIKSLDNNVFALRYCSDDTSWIILVRKKWNTRKQYWWDIIFGTEAPQWVGNKKKLPITCEENWNHPIINHSITEEEYTLLEITYGQSSYQIFVNQYGSFLLPIDNFCHTPLEAITPEQYLLTSKDQLYTIWITLWELDWKYSLKWREVASKVSHGHYLLLRKEKYSLLKHMRDNTSYQYKALFIDWWFWTFSEIPIKKSTIQDIWDQYVWKNLSFKKR